MPVAVRGKRPIAERIAAGVLLALSVLLLTVSLGYGFFDGNRPGPGMYPAIISGGLLLVSLTWLITGAESQAQQENATPADDPEDADAPIDEQPPIDSAGFRRIAFVVAWTLVPLLLLETVGYLISLTVYVAGLLIFIARSRIWIALPATAVGVLGTAYGANALGIVLPDPLNIIQLLGL
ncbi:tripartite tricarboxylate transporter TctB family protein [Saccharopolyspora sp. K220]|uniref:tripartite tricarboxylate transporter TctB family protein n=1 Tax=Saccharopolyspora soli TaxID=2926618 RepID=UPI001F560325|nr:tripartite tricarboxylate transporter TctB family protein [Saccharopolyspora soli]MCI2418402.1 tripartite tricarboxylate transporter TctB family protein [Saccharopolyspora soli]